MTKEREVQHRIETATFYLDLIALNEIKMVDLIKLSGLAKGTIDRFLKGIYTPNAKILWSLDDAIKEIITQKAKENGEL